MVHKGIFTNRLLWCSFQQRILSPCQYWFKPNPFSTLFFCPKLSILLIINASQRWTPTLEINTNTKIAKSPVDDRHVILPLRGFEHVVCGRMSCAQLRARMNFYCQFKAIFPKQIPI